MLNPSNKKSYTWEETEKNILKLSRVIKENINECYNKMNEVMKVLTIMASIFIPLTFIAGIYGMNFDYMPELHNKYSYFIVLGIMFLILVLMLVYFKRNKWL